MQTTHNRSHGHSDGRVCISNSLFATKRPSSRFDSWLCPRSRLVIKRQASAGLASWWTDKRKRSKWTNAVNRCTGEGKLERLCFLESFWPVSSFDGLIVVIRLCVCVQSSGCNFRLPCITGRAYLLLLLESRFLNGLKLKKLSFLTCWLAGKRIHARVCIFPTNSSHLFIVRLPVRFGQPT